MKQSTQGTKVTNAVVKGTKVVTGSSSATKIGLSQPKRRGQGNK
jgi:hypothetical protein